MKHTLITAGVLVGVTTVTVGALYARRGSATPDVTAAAVTRGSIVSVIAATGTLQAVTTVDVGTQVSGTVLALYADFNSIVHKGQLLARLDPSLFQSAIDQRQADLARAEADLQRLQVAQTDADTKLRRARELSARQLIAQSDLDSAEIDARSAAAQVKSGEAQVTQARASLDQARVSLDKAIINSPIDGIVVSRNVDVGQTVAASLQAPTLFQIAADLTKMQLKASIDESDVGDIAKGQPVTFRVDAFPGETFDGVVEQVRLNPTVESNVVTYATIVSAPNPQLKLKPGMTANLTVEVARREDVLRAPAAALRFRPTEDVLAALAGSSVPAAQRQGPGVMWQLSGGAIAPVRVRTGITDGTYVEVLDGLAEGAQVVTRVNLSSSTSSSSAKKATSGSPLIPSRPAGPPPH